jgi:hypothetical protein
MSNVLKFPQNSSNDSFEGILKAYREKVKKIEARDNITILDLKEANIFNIVLRKNIVNISFDSLPETDLAYSCVLILKQDSIGNRKVVFPENVLWSFNEVAVLATKPGFVDVITLMTCDGGETYYASHALANLGK